MWQQYGVGQRDEPSRNVRLVGEDVEARGLDGPVFQGRDQSGFVDGGATADVDEDAAGPERLEDPGIDGVVCLGAGRQDG